MPVPSGFVNPADFPVVDPTTLPSGHAIVISDVFGTPANVLVDLEDIGGGGGSLAVTRDGASFLTEITTINTLGPQLYATGTSPTVNLGVSARYQPASAAALNYYVSASGNDGNTGLSLGQAFLTLQKAIDVISELDTQANSITTINVSGAVRVPFTTELKDSVCSSDRIIRILGVSSGELYTDSSSSISPSMLFVNSGSTRYLISNLKLTHDALDTENLAVTLWIANGSTVSTSDCTFQSLPNGGDSLYTAHVYADFNSIYFENNCTIAGGATNAKHVLAENGSAIQLNGTTAFIGSPTLQTFIQLSSLSKCRLKTYSFTGAPASGCRQFLLDDSSVLVLNGSTLPGNVAGTRSGLPITIENESTLLTSSLNKLNFVGSGVVATNSGSDVIVTINSGALDVLSGDRTYYVRTDGSDSNNGLTNSSSGAFLTIQKAVDVAKSINLDGYKIIIQIGDGTYNLTSTLFLKQYLGSGEIVIQGNPTNATSVVVQSSGTNFNRGLISQVEAGVYTLKNFKIVHTNIASSPAWNVSVYSFGAGSKLNLDNIDFGDLSSTFSFQYHIIADSNATVSIKSNYSISGGGSSNSIHQAARIGGVIYWEDSVTVSFSNNPTFSLFAEASATGVITAYLPAKTGAANIAKNFHCSANSVISNFGATPNFNSFGGATGTTASGGQFV